jgi:hypothetical protein
MFAALVADGILTLGRTACQNAGATEIFHMKTLREKNR